jgi:hypothetical protein
VSERLAGNSLLGGSKPPPAPKSLTAQARC